MMFDLPWQLWVLVFESLLSAVLAVFIINKGSRQYGLKTVGWVLWDIAALVLLYFGADNVSWQHVALALMYLIAIFGGLSRTVQCKLVTFQPLNGGTALFLAVVPLVQILFIITG